MAKLTATQQKHLNSRVNSIYKTRVDAAKSLIVPEVRLNRNEYYKELKAGRYKIVRPKKGYVYGPADFIVFDKEAPKDTTKYDKEIAKIEKQKQLLLDKVLFAGDSEEIIKLLTNFEQGI